ncbi:sensor domain-containing diguanylate cyclase [Paenibacillus sp. OV219]|uniref:sensor domain-containing diguanylate cyclase n=1 Tax=Paenibacillus sp. OV219 TaxID=1884377 RepID=UPI0008BD4BA8|nr:diguanylate cyclase [Paenibacillus sp. OV219]SEM75451.1 diguanylate cyclase (GGDEF) domain-containing protein [Paenibacillus sp. OV219]
MARNSDSQWKIVSKNVTHSKVQQPNRELFQRDVRERDEYNINELLKECFQQWLEETQQTRSPLLHSYLELCQADGQPLMQTGQANPVASHPVIEVKITMRSDDTQLLGLLRFKKQEMSDEVIALLHAAALHIRQIFYHRYDLDQAAQLLMQHQRRMLDESSRDVLFLIAKRLHDQNDVSSVLQVLLEDFAQLYPYAEFQLYLSQDHVNVDPRVKPLLLRHALEDLNAKAFLTGLPNQMEDEQGKIKLAVPMCGKQAVYGVLSIGMQVERWDESELDALIMLADTAGSAFENAKLFEQSNLLISELQLINELTKRLNQSLRLSEVFEFAVSELLSIFKADYCNILQLNNDGKFQVVASNLPQEANESYSTRYGFCGMVYSTKEPLIIADYWSTRIVDSKLMDATGSRSLIAAPLMAGSDVVGVIMVSHQNANYFSYENYKLLQVLSTHIGLAISNASLHAEVRRMVITDNLTGLYARHYLNENIQIMQRKDPYGSLVLVDIDHFKKVNDTYGHLHGDSILVTVSEVIRACIRDSDIAARWGGEELAVYLPKIRTAQAYRIAERIRSMVELHTTPVVTVSCGLSEWTFEDEKISVESLFNKADVALYEAKKKGRNCIVIG